MGDDQGGSYHPEALLAAGAVDVLRVDATTNGGLTRLRPILERARAAGVQVIAAHVPACALTAASRARLQGRADRVGHPGTGVHAMDDPLEQPVVSEGRMESLEDAPGFGRLLEPDGSSNRTLWIPIVYSTTYATTEEGGGMEFLVHITVEWPPDGDADLKQRLIQEEGKRARELADAGVIHRLWRIPGRWANVGLWEAADATALHDALASLPLFPWVRAVVEPLARHPSDPACQPAD